MEVEVSLTPDTAAAVRELLQLAAGEGMTLRIRSARRTCAEQAQQFAIGRQPGDTRQVVTHARGCQSWHVQGRAVDVDIVAGPRDYGRVGAIWKGIGGKWGGDFPGFPDIGHMEYHPGLTVEQTCPDPSHCEDVAIVVDIGDPPRGEASGLGRILFAGAVAVAVGAAAFAAAGGRL